jgi:hypothetical protein
MIGIGAIIFTFRDTSLVLVSTCSRRNNEVKNKKKKQPLTTLALTTVAQKPK